MRHLKNEGGLPLRLSLLEDLALGVVAHVHYVDETAQIELFGSELGHGDSMMDRWVVVDRDEVESCSMRQEALVWGGSQRASRLQTAVVAGGQTATTTKRPTRCNILYQTLEYSKTDSLQILR